MEGGRGNGDWVGGMGISLKRGHSVKCVNNLFCYMVVVRTLDFRTSRATMSTNHCHIEATEQGFSVSCIHYFLLYAKERDRQSGKCTRSLVYVWHITYTRIQRLRQQIRTGYAVFGTSAWSAFNCQPYIYNTYNKIHTGALRRTHACMEEEEGEGEWIPGDTRGARVARIRSQKHEWKESSKG